MEIVVTNQYGLIIFAVTVDENGMPKTLYQGINRAEAVSTYQKAIENPANAKKRVRFYNFRQVYDYVGEEKNKSAYPIKEFYDDTEVYQPSNKDNIETIMVNNNHKLLAPNGKVSNLTAEQWHLVRTPEFKDWFGDWLRHPNRSSKVLDANGEPMVMFHGSNNYQYFTNPYPNYTVFFDPRMSRLEPRTEGGGVYFSNKWDVAAQFSIFNFVVECFINIRKPIKIDGDHSHIWYVIGEERINYGKNDGVILYNTFDTLDGETEDENYVSDIVIARYSNQIKLADGRNTTFDKNDVDIRFEDGGKTHSSNTPEAKKLQKKHDAEILLAPNGKKSNLTPKQWHLVRTPAFKAWFGDWENSPETASKVVDENGEPLVCNHSSSENNIDIFYGNRIFRTSQNNVKPIWFTYKEFHEYAQGEDIYQYRCFLNIRKMFDYSNINDVNKLKKYYIYINGEMLPDYDYNMEWSSQEDYNLPAYIYDMGYDGYKFTDEYSVVVFNSNQIKLADGTNTTFDGSNPDIRYADGGKVEQKVKYENGSSILDKTAQEIVHYYNDTSGFNSEEDAIKEIDYLLNTDFPHGFKNIPNVVVLYRVVLLENGDNVRVYDIGEHYIAELNLIDRGFLEKIGVWDNWSEETELILLTCETEKNNIDIERSIGNRLLYPREHEFTVIDDTKVSIIKTESISKKWVEYADGGKTDVLLAPNGKPSNLTPEQYKLVRTPAFKAWFGDWENSPQEASKVVDSNGEPLVVYRGDASNRHVFNEDTFFSSNDYVAGSYSNEDAVPEYEVFLNIRKPLNLLGGNELRFNPNGSRISGSDPNVVGIFKKAISEMPNDYVVKVGWGDEWDKKTLLNAVIRNHHGIEYIDYNNQSASWEAIIKYAKKQGYDGVFMYDESIDKLIQHQISQIVFHPTQIKLADGSNTTFDGSNPDIRFELGGIYHGSLYRFEKFSTANIGTGESHRSYGWGLYFTEIEEIAKFYANNVSRPILLDKNGNEIKISDELANLIKLGYEKNMMLDTDYIKEKMRIRAKAIGTKWAEDAVKELNQIGYFELVFDRYVYRVTLHKGKTPDQYTWLEWDKPVSAENIIKINKALEKKGIPATPKKYMEVDMDGRVSVGMNGEQVYIELSKIFGDAEFGGDKQASLFLLENGIDGIKYPADKNMAGGFSYVVFDENAVTIEDVEQFAKGGKFHLGGDMSKHLAPNGKPSNLTHEQWHLVRTPAFKAWFGDWENSPETASKVVDENGEPLVVYRGWSSNHKFGNVFDYKRNLWKNANSSSSRKLNRFGFYFTTDKKVAKIYADDFAQSYNDDLEDKGSSKEKATPIVQEYFLKIQNVCDISPNNKNFPTLSEKISGEKNVFSSKPLKEIKERQVLEYTTTIGMKSLGEIVGFGLKDIENKIEREIYQKRYKNNYPFDVFSYMINDGDNVDVLLKENLIEKKYDGVKFQEDTHYYESLSKKEQAIFDKNERKGIIQTYPDVYVAFNPTQIKLADGSNTTFDGSNPDIRYADGGKTENHNYLYKIYDDKEFVRELENLIEKDGSSFICTYVASAIKMLEGDRAKIYGFSQLENPQSQYFADSGEDEDEGHHFAVVDDRYIVDAWIYNNFSKDGKIFGRSVFDMENPNDQDIIKYVYGNKNNWTDITNRVKNEFEEFFPKSALELKEKYKAYKTRTQFNKGGKTNSSRPFSSLDISRVKKGIVHLHSVYPKRITKIDDLPI